MSYREVFQVGAMLLVYACLVISFILWRSEARSAEQFRAEVLELRDLSRKLTKQLVEAEMKREYTSAERDYWHRRSVNGN